MQRERQVVETMRARAGVTGQHLRGVLAATMFAAFVAMTAVFLYFFA